MLSICFHSYITGPPVLPVPVHVCILSEERDLECRLMTQFGVHFPSPACLAESQIEDFFDEITDTRAFQLSLSAHTRSIPYKNISQISNFMQDFFRAYLTLSWVPNDHRAFGSLILMGLLNDYMFQKEWGIRPLIWSLHE